MPELGQGRVVHRRRARVPDRVAEDGQARHQSTGVRRFAAGRRAGFVVAGDVGFEFGFGGGEGVLAAGARLDHVVEVVDLRRVGGGLDRGEAGVADRARRQARVEAGVVGGVDRELRFGQRLVVVAGREADRRVDPERHPFVQAVVDDRRDQRALLVDLRLALDHRGDRQHVVDRQVLRLRVAHVDALDPALEVLQLELDQVGDRRVPLQFEGVGEEDALMPLARLHVVAAQALLLRQLGGLGAVVALGDRHRDRSQNDRRRGVSVEVAVGEGGRGEDRQPGDGDRGHGKAAATAALGRWDGAACSRSGGGARAPRRRDRRRGLASPHSSAPSSIAAWPAR